MKKLAILVCGVVVIALSSCGSDSTKCTCVTHYSGTGVTLPDETVTADSKGAKCSDGNITTTAGEMTVTITCK